MKKMQTRFQKRMLIIVALIVFNTLLLFIVRNACYSEAPASTEETPVTQHAQESEQTPN